MKKTAVVLSVVFLILGFGSLWIGEYLGTIMCFIMSAAWVGLKIHLDHSK